MLRRTPASFVISRTAIALGGGGGASSIPAQNVAVLTEVKSPTVVHERSSFSYSGSAKAADVGARNESAYIGYNPTQPQDLIKKNAMPHMLNLITILPAWMGVFFANVVGWGTFLWWVYAAKNYETIVILRPVEKTE